MSTQPSIEQRARDLARKIRQTNYDAHIGNKDALMALATEICPFKPGDKVSYAYENETREGMVVCLDLWEGAITREPREGESREEYIIRHTDIHVVHFRNGVPHGYMERIKTENNPTKIGVVKF